MQQVRAEPSEVLREAQAARQLFKAKFTSSVKEFERGVSRHRVKNAHNDERTHDYGRSEEMA